MRKIIAVVGMCGSGKSLVCDAIEKKGFTKIHFGGITMDEVKKRGLAVSEENEKKVREELRKKYGMAAYAKLNLPKIKLLLERGNVLIDGLYSWSEYKLLKQEFGDKLMVVAVHASPKIRAARLATRAVRPLTSNEVAARDAAEIETLEKGGPIAMADIVISNEGTTPMLQKQIKQLIRILNL
ncbi:MAG: AAA family ATPase [Candidatus Woesearchaeota archaeon]|nr:AAA family ATPase [Candidatus Woesearchaeota archaeon]